MQEETKTDNVPQVEQPEVPTSQVSQSEDLTKKNAVIGFVLGIFGLVAWTLPVVGAPVTVLGLVYSIKGLKSLKRDLAIAGMVICIIGIVATISNIAIGAYMGATGQHALVNKMVSNDEEVSDPVKKAEFINNLVASVKSGMKLPSVMDEHTTIVDVTAEQDAIRYHYILTGFSKEELGSIQDSSFKYFLVDAVCKNPDTMYLLDRKVNLEYAYAVEGSDQKFFTSITRADCE